MVSYVFTSGKCNWTFCASSFQFHLLPIPTCLGLNGFVVIVVDVVVEV
jgi:hypothetical protein